MSKSFDKIVTIKSLNNISTKLHFREHINNQLILSPKRIDKDITPDGTDRLFNAVLTVWKWNAHTPCTTSARCP